ncbi:Pnap_2097 family protein [Salipiger bermudensis]|uniref:Pnap_2097 family protein n=1 Tax=Salipiger bermudensis TaxID=344736 RepID=UPI001CD589ED|nr:Pnap_2097 family protein [Salipiger bermudensis]MCA1288613.1 hypothetical protein [Salipiger bermudensis]
MLDTGTTGAEVLTRQRLGMQQLSPHGLSEIWALGFCGDLHWQMLADALGQKGFGFRVADGRPLYAAFCATRIELSPQQDLLGGELTISSRLAGIDGARVGSSHEFRQDGRVIGSLLMLSAFVTHDESGSNRRIVRARPDRDCALAAAGPDLQALNARARERTRAQRGTRILDGSLIHPNPALDFNAVGLLYFPSFTRIIEMTAGAAQPVARREIIYLGNLDPGEAVRVHRRGSTAVVARPDGQIIASAFEDRLGEHPH